VARVWARRAAISLDRLKESPARDSLAALVEFVTMRTW